MNPAHITFLNTYITIIYAPSYGDAFIRHKLPFSCFSMHFHSDMRININRNICTASVCSFKFPYKFLHVLYSYGVVKFQCTIYNLAQFFRHITIYAAKGQLLLSGTSVHCSKWSFTGYDKIISCSKCIYIRPRSLLSCSGILLHRCKSRFYHNGHIRCFV